MSTKSGTTSSGRSSSTNSLNHQQEAVQDTHEPTNGSEPKARLCHLKKWPNFQGYGFNLHAERSRLGQHIGKVDANSPAESAGLREGDRIIEVNYVNISNENHQQVVKRIRSGLEYEGETHDDEVILLVVDRQADEWFKNRGVIVRSSDPEFVVRLATAKQVHIDSQPANDHNNNVPALSDDVKRVDTPPPQPSPSSQGSVKKGSSLTPSPDTKAKLSSSSNSSLNAPAPSQTQIQTVTPKSTNNKQVNGKSQVASSQVKTSPHNSNSSSSASSTLSTTSSSLNRTGMDKTNGSPKDDVYKMSAAEFKNYLKSKGRNDPRGISIDMRRKYEIFQNM